jgi:DNA-binding CsgD family transcriptional regulator
MNGVAARPSNVQLEQMVAGLDGGLSPREVQVCARALRGMTREGIGLDLGVKTSTVNTLSQRAYRKLNISSLNELFALCLSGPKESIRSEMT